MVQKHRKKGGPAFASPITLVAPHQGIGYGELLDERRPPRPGIRSQIAVVDYDEDGKLDLLVGDFCTNLHVKHDLTDQQRTDLDRVVRERDDAAAGLRARMERLRADFKIAMRGVPQSDWETPENQAKWQAMYKEMKDSTIHKELRERYDKSQSGLKAFAENPRSQDGDADVAHGYVWYFHRK